MKALLIILARLVQTTIIALLAFGCSKSPSVQVKPAVQEACEAYIASNSTAQALAKKSGTPVQAVALFVCQDSNLLAEFAADRGKAASDTLLAALANQAGL
jgi:hypothetical protein